MKETTFVIEHLDNGWVWQDINDEDTAYLYCSEELEVPDEWIEELDCYREAIRISLHRDRSYFTDDWFVNLQRLSSQSA
ncbi:MAG: hypothetical protein R3302_01990 [Sulfurimonadaceae bacterium]|nr:hypothetical protein [Sulfurimonadaceae bacterium]